MAERPGASVGVVLAGVALAGLVLPWQTSGWPVPPAYVAAGTAAVALVVFLAGRHGLVGPTASAPVAGVAVAGLAGVGLAALVMAGKRPLDGNWGAVLALATGVLGIPAAVAHWYGIGRQRLVEQVAATLGAFGVGGLSLLVGTVVSLLPLLVLGDTSAILRVAVATPMFSVGLALVAAGYLAVRDLDLSYVDIEVPGLRDLAYAVAGTVVLLGAVVAVSLLFRALGVPAAQSAIEQQATEGDPSFLLVLVPLSYLAIAPGEELVFRNVVQKYLGEHFSSWAAVVVASVVFAAVHFQQYADPNPVATLNTLVVILFLSLVLGFAYERTENLTVPILIHGSINAVQFAALYIRITGGV